MQVRIWAQLVSEKALYRFSEALIPSIFPLRPIVNLMGTMETQSEPSELELDDVVITNPHIEAILENEDWIEDAS